jgi:hypothetical protein
LHPVVYRPTDVPDESKVKVVHREKKYPIDVWPNIMREGIIKAVSDIIGTACHVRESTRYPVQTDAEILIATGKKSKCYR